MLDGAVSRETLAAARAEAARMRAGGMLKPTPQRAAGTRLDSVRWLDEREVEAGGYPALAGLVRMMKGLASEVEVEAEAEGGALIPPLLVPRQCMLAVYEGEGVSFVGGIGLVVVFAFACVLWCQNQKLMNTPRHATPRPVTCRTGTTYRGPCWSATRLRATIERLVPSCTSTGRIGTRSGE